MTAIYIFCEQIELRGWIVELCNSKDLRLLYFADDRDGRVIEANELAFWNDCYQIFLFPRNATKAASMSLNDVRQREWGWANVRPGGVRHLGHRSVLLLSEIHGEKPVHGRTDPQVWVQWLKKRIKSEVYQGVRGTNVITRGHSFYRDIWYTSKAKQLLEAGIVWKQSPNDNSEFEPEG